MSGFTDLVFNLALITWINPMSTLTNSEFVSLVSNGKVQEIRLVYPTAYTIDRAFDYVVEKEYSYSAPSENTPQWVEWMWRDQTSDKPWLEHQKEKTITVPRGVMQDALAIAPLNITPALVLDFQNQRPVELFSIHAALKDKGYGETEALSRAVLVLSGLPTYTGGLEKGYNALWRRRLVSEVRKVKPAVLSVRADGKYYRYIADL